MSGFRRDGGHRLDGIASVPEPGGLAGRLGRAGNSHRSGDLRQALQLYRDLSFAPYDLREVYLAIWR